MTVVLFPRHRLRRPSSCTHDPDDLCIVCDGGLSWCETCHGAESCLPTECPQRPMSSDEQDSVTAGLLDFRGGRWVEVQLPPVTYDDFFPTHPMCRCTLIPTTEEPE